MRRVMVFLVGAALAFGLVATAQAQMPEPEMQMMQNMNEQAAGQYPQINLQYTRPLGMQQRAWSDPLEHMGEGQTRPGYARYVWNQDLVLPVRLREGMITLVNFPPWEVVENVYIGDKLTFDGSIASANGLLLHPKYPGADSNMIVFGQSGNRYVFYLRSETYNTETLTHSIVDIMIPPGTPGAPGSPGSLSHLAGQGSNALATLGGGGAALSPAAAMFTASNSGADWIKDIPTDPTQIRFDLEVFVPRPEDASIAPERVWRDDIFTYIDLGERVVNMLQRPVVTLVVDASETPVGFRAAGPNGRLIVVEAIGDLVLRNGDRVVCVKLRRGVDGIVGSRYHAGEAEPWARPGPLLPPSRQGNPWASDDWQNPAMGGMGAHMMGGGMGGYGPISNGGMAGIAGAPDSIAVQLGSADRLDKLERLWTSVQGRFGEQVQGYEAYFAVESTPDGSSPSGAPGEMFHLRIGPVASIPAGDQLCDTLGRGGIRCSVVRVQ